MMSKERELLQRCLDEFEYKGVACNELCIDINKLLAKPEQEPVEDRIARWHRLGYEQGKKASKREPLTPQQISEGNQSMFNATREAFVNGIKYAEKMHGIGGEE